MIEKIKIKNFQSHSDSEIVFSPNVTVITGRSQSGKTAILRSFNWLINNRPKGFRFHSYFSEDPTKVELNVDGNKIEHFKSEKNEKYILNGKFFEGMSSSVPDEIVSLLNIGDINIQDQLEEPFLITSSPGNIARVINDITNLDKVDLWVSSLTTKINSINKEISICEEGILSLEEKISKYEGVDQASSLLDLFDSISEKIENNGSYIEQTQNLLEDIQFCENTLKRLRWIEEAIDLLKELEGVYFEIQKEEEIILLKEEIEGLDLDVELIEEINKEYMDLVEIDKWIESFNLVRELINKLEMLNSRVESIEGKEKEFKKEYIDILKKNKICPTCFSEVNEKMVGRIKEMI